MTGVIKKIKLYLLNNDKSTTYLELFLYFTSFDFFQFIAS